MRQGIAKVADPNVTPMIDVLLVLLIVFMVLAARVHHTLDVQLPQPENTAIASPVIVLEVLPGPAYRINGTVVPAPGLARALTQVYEGRPEKVLQVAGDRSVPYSAVIRAMDVATSAGVRVIGIVPR